MLGTAEQLAGRVRRLQIITVIWMVVEALVSLVAAWRAHSPALLGFGGDSAVELFSASVVLWRFMPRVESARREKRAARLAGVLLIVLAAFVALTAGLALSGHVEVRPSRLGMVLLILAAVFMPLLARKKEQLAAVTKSAALRADAVESRMCGYLALIALAGLALNTYGRLSWADPVAALCLIPLILREGWEAIRGEEHCEGEE